MSKSKQQRAVPWPVRILIHVYQLRASGYVRVTERDLVRQWENLNKSMRTHLTYLQDRGFVELSALTPDNCYVRLTDAGAAFVEAGIAEAASSPPQPNGEASP
jgi:hypothetical protein